MGTRDRGLGMREMRKQGEKFLLTITHYPLPITYYPMPHAQFPIPDSLIPIFP
ncbi:MULTISPECIES: hypothetical protein [unclassified Tolypothrix]|uniref:hypothetical protein n=1 Tax=unclassified Tolypothrix TaxID=2649714 RepID=UPI0005EAC59B|nr:MULTISPECIES: hypothetical protein [unclassified Tolypothrix]EKE99154.1 acetyl-CoA carboxylase biotin carboxyl carrier protein [Tolypothrix sp. PCC 7601]UYD38106.1 hypothetical protein HG267_08590 [Tolypothrix sp. PCC 7601]